MKQQKINKIIDDTMKVINLKPFTKPRELIIMFREALSHPDILWKEDVEKVIDEYRKRKYHIHRTDECDCCKRNLENIFELLDKFTENKERVKNE